MHYCGEFDDLTCCSNVMAQEVTDGFEHLMNVGGTGGVPVDDERCLQYAKQTYIALKDYFCLMCNPRHVKYLGCCNDAYKMGGYCKDPTGAATPSQLMSVYGTGTCKDKAADTVRICESFADRLWDGDVSKYDSCGMMGWVTGDPVGEENAWSDKKDENGVVVLDDIGNQQQNGNPNGVLPWGDVDGRTGE